MDKQTKYVPILKWKSAELTALKHIPELEKKMIIPVAEIVLPSVVRHKDKERKIKKTDAEMHFEMVEKLKSDKVFKIPNEFKKAWGKNKIFVDVTYLHDEGRTTDLKISILDTIISQSRNEEVQAIPVVNISDNPLFIAGVKNILGKMRIDEVCLRVSVPNLKNIDDTNSKIAALLNTLGVSIGKVHLLVDLKYIGGTSVNYKELFYIAQKISGLREFHNFIFASGAFPVDMTECLFEEPTYIPREDWLNWKKYSQEAGLVRVPTYSDYSIRHPLYDDSLQFFESTSTIKYTLESEWMIIKGKKRALHLYLVHASLFVSQPEFEKATFGGKGEFSYGDGCIVEKAAHFKLYSEAQKEGRNIRGTGTAPLWIGYSMSHHTALVIHQLSNPLD